MRGKEGRERRGLGSVGCQELGSEGEGFREGLACLLVLPCPAFSTDIHELVLVVGKSTKHTSQTRKQPET